MEFCLREQGVRNEREKVVRSGEVRKSVREMYDGLPGERKMLGISWRPMNSITLPSSQD